MKKGLKVLSAAMALSFGVIGANVMTAFEGEKFLPTAPKAQNNPYYRSIITEAAIKDADAAQKATDAVAKDAKLWGALLNQMCDLAQDLAEAKAELAATDSLVTVAEDTMQVPADVQDETVGQETITWSQLRGHTVRKSEYEAAKNGKTKTVFGVVLDEGMDVAAKNKMIKKMLDEENELKKVVAKYGAPAQRNQTVAALQGDVKEMTAAMSILDAFTTKNGISFDGAKCAAPLAMITSPALKKAVEEKKAAEAKKDTVPNTAAKSYFFAAECPKAEVAEKVAPMFKFADLANFDLFAPCAAEKTMDVVPNTGAAR